MVRFAVLFARPLSALTVQEMNAQGTVGPEGAENRKQKKGSLRKGSIH